MTLYLDHMCGVIATSSSAIKDNPNIDIRRSVLCTVPQKCRETYNISRRTWVSPNIAFMSVNPRKSYIFDSTYESVAPESIPEVTSSMSAALAFSTCTETTRGKKLDKNEKYLIHVNKPWIFGERTL